jgi:hypothetical protein
LLELSFQAFRIILPSAATGATAIFFEDGGHQIYLGLPAEQTLKAAQVPPP